MTSILKGSIVTANLLRDGEVVFLTPSGAWSRSIDDAELVVGPEATAALLERARPDERKNLVTGLYTFDAERVGDKIKASHIRERIRTLGPTIRLDTGKQAEGTSGSFNAEGV